MVIGDKWFLRHYRDVNENGVLVRKRASVCLGPRGRESKVPPKSILEAGLKHLAELRSNSLPELGGLKVGDYFEKVYLLHLDSSKRPSTSTGSRAIWERHLRPQLLQVGNRRIRAVDLLLSDVAAFHVQNWLDRMLAVSPKPLSVSFLQQAKFLLSGGFKHALQLGYRATSSGNPATFARIPSGAVPAQPTFAYSAFDIRRMLELFEEPARTIIAVAAVNACRVGELEGLNWEDYHSDTQTLNISRSIWHGKTLNPKTQASCAPLSIPWQLSAMLEVLREKDGNLTTGPIFRTSIATRLSMHNVRCRLILPVLNACVICGKERSEHWREQHEYQRDPSRPKWTGWHSFRRATATDLQHAGAPIAVAQAALRHGDPATTQRFYVRTVPELVSQATQRRADNQIFVDGHLRTPNRALKG